jgi:hypothetical protein
MKVLLLLLLPNVDAYSTATSRHFAHLSRHAPLQLAVVESDVIAATQVASAISETLPAAGRVVPTMRKRDRLRQMLQFPRNAVSVGKAINEAAEELVGDSCDVDAPEVCEDESKFKAAKRELGALIRKSLFFWQGSATNKDLAETEADSMESGWVQRGQGSAFKRTTEVWGFLARSGLRVVKAGKTKGTPEEVSAAKTAAAEFIRDGLFTLGPTFVKLGQVVSTYLRRST